MFEVAALKKLNRWGKALTSLNMAWTCDLVSRDRILKLALDLWQSCLKVRPAHVQVAMKLREAMAIRELGAWVPREGPAECIKTKIGTLLGKMWMAGIH